MSKVQITYYKCDYCNTTTQTDSGFMASDNSCITDDTIVLDMCSEKCIKEHLAWLVMMYDKQPNRHRFAYDLTLKQHVKEEILPWCKPSVTQNKLTRWLDHAIKEYSKHER